MDLNNERLLDPKFLYESNLSKKRKKKKKKKNLIQKSGKQSRTGEVVGLL